MQAAIQKALVARLRATVSDVGQRVFDRIPESAAFPYIAIGAIDVVDDEAESMDPATVTATIHVWSQAVGAVECRRICAATRTSLRGWAPNLSADGFDAGPIRHDQTRDMQDADGLSTHGIVVVSVDVDKS